MAPYWSDDWGNPSSRQHRLGLTASAAVNLARRQIANALAVTPQQLVFTSGATEANNLALLGHARARGSGHLISVALNTTPYSIRSINCSGKVSGSPC